MTTRTSSLPTYTGTRISALPFANDQSHWSPSPATSFVDAIAQGEAYAAHMARWLNDNAEFVGGNALFQVMKAIVAAGGFSDDGPGKGYVAGFCSGIERWALDA